MPLTRARTGSVPAALRSRRSPGRRGVRRRRRPPRAAGRGREHRRRAAGPAGTGAAGPRRVGGRQEAGSLLERRQADGRVGRPLPLAAGLGGLPRRRARHRERQDDLRVGPQPRHRAGAAGAQAAGPGDGVPPLPRPRRARRPAVRQLAGALAGQEAPRAVRAGPRRRPRPGRPADRGRRRSAGARRAPGRGGSLAVLAQLQHLRGRAVPRAGVQGAGRRRRDEGEDLVRQGPGRPRRPQRRRVHGQQHAHRRHRRSGGQAGEGNVDRRRPDRRGRHLRGRHRQRSLARPCGRGPAPTSTGSPSSSTARPDAAEKASAIKATPKLRAYYGRSYVQPHKDLAAAIAGWLNAPFKPNGKATGRTNRAAVGGYVDDVAALFRVIHVPGVGHEEIVRGHALDDKGAAVRGQRHRRAQGAQRPQGRAHPRARHGGDADAEEGGSQTEGEGRRAGAEAGHRAQGPRGA